MEPEVTAHFDDIHELLFREIATANTSIIAAVAWFTDREILSALRRRAAHGVSVRVAITDDEINRPPKAPVFDALIDLGGEIHRIKPGTRRESLMHHKFCVIDEKTVITGSYNWTRRARGNAENVTVVRYHPSFAARFIDTFDQIVGKQKGTESRVDTTHVKKRLELIRNLIQLGDLEDLLPHTRKLRNIADEACVREALTAIDAAEYGRALEEIEKWLARASALVTNEDVDLPYLRLQLDALELELSAISAEYADLERRIVVFNRRHHDALGDLTQAVLFAKSELRKLQAKIICEDKKAQAQAEEAAQTAEEMYREYAEEHHKIQKVRPPEKLDSESEKTLKQMYRSACQLCHPDKVEDQFKVKATEVFQQLEAAYRAQEVKRVQQILERLKKDSWSMHDLSSVLTEASRLRGAISEMKHRIKSTVMALKELKESAAVRLVESIGDSEESWDAYMVQSLEELKSELRALELEIDELRD